jgi:hypothetical protein
MRSNCRRSVAHSAVAAYLCQKKISFDPHLVHRLPGANLAGSGDCHDRLRWRRLRIDAHSTVSYSA